MATSNGVETRAREAMRQAGFGWSETPVEIKDVAAPEAVPFEVLRVEEPVQVAAPVPVVHPVLASSIIHDLLIAGLGLVTGFGFAFVITYVRLGK